VPYFLSIIARSGSTTFHLSITSDDGSADYLADEGRCLSGTPTQHLIDPVSVSTDETILKRKYALWPWVLVVRSDEFFVYRSVIRRRFRRWTDWLG